MNYKYYMTQRPPMPGAMPKQGLIGIDAMDAVEYCDAVGHNVYAVLTYDRQLTAEEVRNYELTPVTYRVGFTKKELTFLTMCLEASVMKSKIGEAGLLGDLWMKLDKALENGGEYDED